MLAEVFYSGDVLVKKKPVDIDVLSHALVPEMKILSNGERKKVLDKYKINEKQLPRMNVEDAEAKALNAAAGDIISIQRKDLTGNYTAYRIVVE